jgi:hypothetical protein
MFGRTAKAVSPTSPRVTLLTASASTGSFKYGATADSVSVSKIRRQLTVYQHPIGKRVNSPHVGCPVRVTEPPGKGEQAGQQLRHLAPERKGAEGGGKDEADTGAELDAVEPFDAEERARVQAVGAQEVDEVGRC